MITNSPPVQVHLIAPPMLGWGLQRLVQTAGPQVMLTGSSATLQQALPLLELHPPDAVVLDFDDGYTLEDICDLHQRLRIQVLVLTSQSDAATVAGLLECGARAVLLKRQAPSALLKAIEKIGAGEADASPVAPDRMPAGSRDIMRRQDEPSAKIATLTARERQTIAAVTSDASVPMKVIADRLCISDHTLRNHLTSIYSKLGVSGRLDLWAFASAHQLNRPEFACNGKR